jgi:hypothetical protein
MNDDHDLYPRAKQFIKDILVHYYFLENLLWIANSTIGLKGILVAI